MLVSIKKAAEILGVSQSTLRNWDKTGKLKSLRTPGNARRYNIETLKQFIKLMGEDVDDRNIRNNQ